MSRNREQQTKHQLDTESILQERQDLYQSTLIEHDKRIQELSASHAKQCEDLCREVITANEEIARLNKQLQIQQSQHLRSNNNVPSNSTTPSLLARNSPSVKPKSALRSSRKFSLRSESSEKNRKRPSGTAVGSGRSQSPFQGRNYEYEVQSRSFSGNMDDWHGGYTGTNTMHQGSPAGHSVRAMLRQFRIKYLPRKRKHRRMLVLSVLMTIMLYWVSDTWRTVNLSYTLC